jgi:folate-dependent phosphoribosylglycinamide formyltransferase PurN
MKKMSDILFLATDHNVAKAYLYKSFAAGLVPSKIIYLKFTNLNTLRSRIKLLVKNIIDFSKKSLSQNKLCISSAKAEKEILKIIKSYLISESLYSGDLNKSTKAILRKFKWKFDELIVNNINDPKLVNYLSKTEEKFVVFMGGGILKKQLLGCGKKFIHVHPGIVPEVKGADCLLWSVLVKESIGTSAFFMNEKIDTGDILITQKYPIPVFSFDPSEIDNSRLKKILINYVDPHYRADTLIKLLKSALPRQWNCTMQDPVDGQTFYFMHPKISKIACEKFFEKGIINDT